MRKIACSFILLSILSNSTYAQLTILNTQDPATETAATDTISTQQAAPSNMSQTNVIPGMTATNASKVFGSLSAGYSSNFYEANSTQAKMESSLEALVNVRIKGAHVLRTYLAGTQDQNKGKETHLKDGYLAWVNDGLWYRGKVTTLSQQIRLAAPMSKESVKRDEKLTGISVAPVAMFNLTPVGLMGVMLIYQPMVTKNFHKYETNRAYKSNNEYSTSQLFRALWSFTEKAYFLSDFIYRTAWSYGGARKDDTSEYALSLGYMFTQALSVSAGVSTESSVRNFENAQDQNVRLFNGNTSTYNVGLNYVF